VELVREFGIARSFVGLSLAWVCCNRTRIVRAAQVSTEPALIEAWQDGGGMIIVGFLASGEVAFKLFDPVPEASFADKLHRWLLRI
jgi:hypothetical protein